MDVSYLFEDEVLEEYKSPMYLQAECLCLIFHHNLYNYFDNLTGHQDLEGHREQYASLNINTFYNLLDPYLRKKISLESILQFFNRHDYNCEGKLYASVLYPLYRRSRYGVESFEESTNIFAKSKCIPGVVDIFLNDLPQSFQHIVEFVARNRASCLLVTPDLTRPLLRLSTFRSSLCQQLNQPVRKRLERRVKGAQGSRVPCGEVSALLDTLAIVAPSQHPLRAFMSVFKKIPIFPLSSTPPHITFYQINEETTKGLKECLRSFSGEPWAADLSLWLRLILGDINEILELLLMVEKDLSNEARTGMMMMVDESIERLQTALDGDKKQNSNDADFVKIFSLLSLVYRCQMSKKNKKKYNFERLLNAEVDEDTGVVRRKIIHDFNNTLVVSKHPLTPECPSFEIELNKNTLAQNTDYHDVCVGLVYKDYNHSLRAPGNNNFTMAYDLHRYNVNSGYNSYYMYNNFRLCNKIKFQIDFEEHRVYMIFKGEEKMYREFPPNLPLHPAFTIKSYSTITLPDPTPWRPYLSLVQERPYVPQVNMDMLGKMLLLFNNHVDIQGAMLRMIDCMTPLTRFSKKDCKLFRDVIYRMGVPLHLQNMGDVLCCNNHQRNKYFHMYLDKLLSYDDNKQTHTKNKAMFLCMCASMCAYPSLIVSLPSSSKKQGFIEKLLTTKKTFFKILDASKFFSTIQSRVYDEDTTNENGEREEMDSSDYYSLLCVIQSGFMTWLKKHDDEEDEEEDGDKEDKEGKNKKNKKSSKGAKNSTKNEDDDDDNDDDDVMKGEEEEEKIRYFYTSYLDRLVGAVSVEMQLLATFPEDEFTLYIDNPAPSLLYTVFKQLLLWLEGSTRAVESLKSLSHLHSFVLPLVDKIKCLKESRVDIFMESGDHWFNQMLCSYYRVVGLLCSNSIQVLPDMKVTRKQLEKQNAPELDHKSLEVAGSELWRSIFRAGQLNFNRKYVERSYSGKHEAVSESDVLNMLLQLSDGEADHGAQNFLQIVQKKSQSPHVTMGGPSVTSSIVTLFSALCWHTQVIRQDLEKYVEKYEESKVTDAIVHAYIMAEKSRLSLMKKRQGMHHNQSINDETPSGENADYDAEDEGGDVSDCPIEKVRLKARYLLNFAGLVQQHAQRKETSLNDVRESKLIKLYPSFPLVLQFVNDNSWNQSEVDRLLSERRMVASRLAEGYHLIICALQKLALQPCHKMNDEGGSTQLDNDGGSSQFDSSKGNERDDKQNRILNDFYMSFFLAGLLSKQHNFSKGRSENIDGCGLTLETRLRKYFYDLIKLLINSCLSNGDHEDNGEKDSDKFGLFKKQFKSMITVVTLHFLDTRWQVDDLPMLVELKLPSFLFHVLEEKRKRDAGVNGTITDEDGGDKVDEKKKGTIWDYTNGSIYQLRDDYTNLPYGPPTYVTAGSKQADKSKHTEKNKQVDTAIQREAHKKPYISIEEYLWHKHFSGDDLDMYKTNMQWIKEATSMETSNFKSFYCDLTNFQNDLLTKLFLCRYRMLLSQYYQCDLCHRSVALKTKGKEEKMARKKKNKKKKLDDKLSDVFSSSMLWGEEEDSGGGGDVGDVVSNEGAGDVGSNEGAGEGVDDAIVNVVNGDEGNDGDVENGNNNNTNTNNNGDHDVVDIIVNGHDDRRNDEGNNDRASSSSSSVASSEPLFSDDESEEPHLAFRCLECSDADCCIECFSKLSQPKCAGHQMVLLKWVCKGCWGAIIGSKYKCITCKEEEEDDDDNYYCYGCFHTNNWETGSDCSGHTFEVTKVPRARADHTEDCNIDSYIQQQSFLLISYLSLLSRHHLLNSSPLTPATPDDCVIKSLLNPHDVTNEYLCSASSVYKECVEKLADIMKGVWKDGGVVERKRKKKDPEGDKKDKSLIEVKRKSFKDIWNWHEILPALFCRLVGTEKGGSRGVPGCDVINMAGDADDKKLIGSLPELFSSNVILKTLIFLLKSPHERCDERKTIIIITILTRIILHVTECTSDLQEFIEIMINLASHTLNNGTLAVAKCVVESLQQLLLSNVVVADKIEEYVVKHLCSFQHRVDKDIHSYLVCAYVFAGFPKIPCYGTLAKSKKLSIDKNTMLIIGKVNKGGKNDGDDDEEDEEKKEEEEEDDDDYEATFELIQVHDRSKIELPLNQLKLVNVGIDEYAMKEHNSQSLLGVLNYVMQLTNENDYPDENSKALTKWFCIILMKAIHNSNNNNNKKNMNNNNENNKNNNNDKYGGMTPELLCNLLTIHLKGTSLSNKWVTQHFEMAALKFLAKKKKNDKKHGDDSENNTSQQQQESTTQDTTQQQEGSTTSENPPQQSTTNEIPLQQEQPEASSSQSSIQTDSEPQHASGSETSLQTDSTTYEQQQLNHYRNFTALTTEQLQQLKELYLNCDPLNDIPDSALKIQLAFMCEDENNLNRYVCRALYNLYFPRLQDLMDSLVAAAESRDAWTPELKKELELVEYVFKGTKRPKKTEGNEEEDDDDIDETVDVTFNAVDFMPRHDPIQKQVDLSSDEYYSEEFMLKTAPLFEDQTTDDDEDSCDSDKNKMDGRLKESRELFKRSLKREGGLEKVLDAVSSHYSSLLLARCFTTHPFPSIVHLYNSSLQSSSSSSSSQPLAQTTCSLAVIKLMTKCLFDDNFLRDLSYRADLEPDKTAAKGTAWCKTFVKNIISSSDDSDSIESNLTDPTNTASKKPTPKRSNTQSNEQLECMRSLTEVAFDMLEGWKAHKVVTIKANQPPFRVNVPNASHLLIHARKDAQQGKAKVQISSSKDMISQPHNTFPGDENRVYIKGTKAYFKAVSNAESVTLEIEAFCKHATCFNAGWTLFEACIDLPSFKLVVDVQRFWRVLICLVNRMHGKNRLKLCPLLSTLIKNNNNLNFELLSPLWGYFLKLVNEPRKPCDAEMTKDGNYLNPGIHLALVDLFRNILNACDESPDKMEKFKFMVDFEPATY